MFNGLSGKSAVLIMSAALLLVSALANAQPLSLAINNGRVLDPDSGLDAIRSVGVRDGKIVEISETPLSAEHVIDASGQVVSPGFINLHTHGVSDAGQRLELLDGITTALELEAGAFPVTGYGEHSNLDEMAWINYGPSVGHASIRIQVVGGVDLTDMMSKGNLSMAANAFTDPATPEQIGVMRERLVQGIEQGGLGIGLLLDYMTRAIDDQEMKMVFEVAAEHHVPIFVHVRRGLAGDPAGLDEVIAMAAQTGAAVHICHLNASAMSGTLDWLRRIDIARADGIDITTEMFPWTAGSTSISADVFSRNWREIFAIDYGDVQWAETGEWLTEESFEHYRKTRPDGQTAHHYIKEQWNRDALSSEHVLVASDAMPIVSYDRKVVPNGAGTSARILGQFVRDEGLLSLNDAIRKLSLLPAKRLESFAPAFANKGRIKIGADADITVFDPQTVSHRASYEEPFLPPTGINHVIINGQVAVKNAELQTDVHAGRLTIAR